MSHLAGGVPCPPPCPHSANSQTPNKGIISPSHDIIFPFTHCLNGTLYGFLSHLSFPSHPPSISFCLSHSVAFPTPPCSSVSLPACPLSASVAFSPDPFHALLFSHSDLTEGLCTEVTLVTLSLPFSLTLSGGKSHTHQFAGSAPDEQARKENINEAPQPINT